MIKIVLLVIHIAIGQTYGRSVLQNGNQLSLANNHLGLQLLNHLSDTNDNIFFSPFSISNAFGVLYAGAEGVTAEEMSRVLGYSRLNLSDHQIKEQFQSVLKEIQDLKESEYQLDIANKLLIQEDFNVSQSYHDDIKKYFRSSVESIDFVNEPTKTVNEINEWVSHQTRQKIPEILSQPLSPLTRLVIINAIYFKGVFQTKFNKNLTEEDIFRTASGKESSVPMMFRRDKFNYTEVPEFDSKLLEIPYSGDDISLYILLPNQRQGLKNLKNNLTDLSIVEQAINSLTEKTVSVMIPKFKIETSYDLNDILPELGMSAVFTEDADLSGITKNAKLKVSKAIHKAFVEVTEEGTEAAAVTVISSSLISAIINPPPLFFRADHPFMFFIRHNRNGMLLFVGNVNKI